MEQSDAILNTFYSCSAANISFLAIYLISSLIVLIYRVYSSCSWCFKGKKKEGEESPRHGQRKKPVETIDPGAIEF